MVKLCYNFISKISDAFDRTNVEPRTHGFVQNKKVLIRNLDLIHRIKKTCLR